MNSPLIKVLLIEDAPKYARIMREMLQEYRGTKFQLHWVASVDAGLQCIAEITPDVLLLDLGVAVARGTETVPEILEAAPCLPIIILSSLDDEEAALKA